ncbi:hypothetical protein FRC04_004897 [Tulasnella sp. 424]|nr:hypothetical protein FRC04_004897 [Tulasnella sp. 424]KAG8975660.1 hypothetical protein FRC05_005178 [Tulasnella sp. 425]
MFTPILAASLAALAGSAAAKGTPTHNRVAARQDNFTPLASQHFTYTNLPYHADPNDGERGTQFGYNICNSTTEGPTSNCQTLIINSLDDFCLWGPPTPNSEVGTTEGESVAWCTKAGHGTRIIPAGAITGAQFMKTPDYIQITGLINQANIDMDPNDGGGEMDPHGADQRGNPLGGLVFSTVYGTGGGYEQVIEWHNFMGSNVFCLKACDPKGAHAADFCQHVFDRIGCQYNAPASYVDGEFTSCLGDSQDFPGVYTGADGKVTTYVQPAESLGAISTMPYTARIPASSSCTTYSSAALYSGQPAATVAATSSVPATSAAAATSPAVSGAAAQAAKSVSSASKASASASSSASATGNAAGAPAKFGMGGVWSIAIGVVGAAVGAVVAL